MSFALHRIGRAATLAALTTYFDVPIGVTPIPWHHQRMLDHELLLHRTGPTHNHGSAFLHWARRAASHNPLFTFDDACRGRVLMTSRTHLTIARYDRGDLLPSVHDTDLAYALGLQAARAGLVGIAAVFDAE